MKKFQFNLESVLKLRKREEEKVVKDMSAVTSRLNQIQDKIEKTQRNLKEYEKDKIKMMGSTSYIAIYTNLKNNSRQILQAAEEEKTELNQEMDKWREKLKEAMHKRKAMEILKQKQKQEFQKEHKKREAIDSAELAARTQIKMLF